MSNDCLLFVHHHLLLNQGLLLGLGLLDLLVLQDAFGFGFALSHVELGATELLVLSLLTVQLLSLTLQCFGLHLRSSFCLFDECLVSLLSHLCEYLTFMLVFNFNLDKLSGSSLLFLNVGLAGLLLDLSFTFNSHLAS